MTKRAFIVIWFGTAFGATLVGFLVGHHLGKQQRPCAECCAKGELCENEEEWTMFLMDCASDAGEAKEISRLLGECWEEQKQREREMLSLDQLPAMTQCSLALAMCRGGLKECQRQ